MELEHLQNILIKAKKFHAGPGVVWQFNETTISINGSPVTHYLLYLERETESFVLMPTMPLEVAEDYFVSIVGEDRSPYAIALTPRYSKEKVIILKEEQL